MDIRFSHRAMAAMFAAILTLSLSAEADAQRGKGKGKGGPPVRVSGVVTAFDGKQLTIKAKSGELVTVAVPDKPRVSTLTRAAFSDLKTGDFVASAGIRQGNGNLHAIELRIFPEQLRGRGEGHRPFPGGPDHTMTNATIEAVVGSVSDRTIKVAYKGGEKVIVVPKNVLVMRMGRGNASLLRPGANVSIFARKRGERVVAVRISVGLNGLVPPG